VRTPPQVCWIETGGPQPLALAPIDTEHKIRGQEETERRRRRKIPRVETHAKLIEQSQRPVRNPLADCNPRTTQKRSRLVSGTPIAHRERCSGFHLHGRCERLQSISGSGGTAFDRATSNTTSIWHDDLSSIAGLRGKTRHPSTSARMPIHCIDPRNHHQCERLSTRAWMPWQENRPGPNTRGTAWATFRRSLISSRWPVMWHFYETEMRIFGNRHPWYRRFAAAQATALRTRCLDSPLKRFHRFGSGSTRIDSRSPSCC